MAGIYLSGGELHAMNLVRTAYNAGGVKFGLYVNDVVIPEDGELTMDDLDEASFPGYAEIPSDEFTAVVINEDGVATCAHPVIQWDCEGGEPDDQTVYGWYMRLAAGDETLLVVEPLPAPKLMDAAGKYVRINPVIGGESKNAP